MWAIHCIKTVQKKSKEFLLIGYPVHFCLPKLKMRKCNEKVGILPTVHSISNDPISKIFFKFQSAQKWKIRPCHCYLVSVWLSIFSPHFLPITLKISHFCWNQKQILKSSRWVGPSSKMAIMRQQASNFL